MPNQKRPKTDQRPAPPPSENRGEEIPRGANQKRPAGEESRQGLEDTGGPFSDPYDTGMKPDNQTPNDSRDNARPTHRGADENNWVNWEDQEPENPGGWERSEESRAYPAESSVNDLRGYAPGESRAPDDDIRQDIYQLLAQNPFILASDVNVTVTNGSVRLDGFVLDENLKQMAESIARQAQGVTEVENRLQVGTGRA